MPSFKSRASAAENAYSPSCGNVVVDDDAAARAERQARQPAFLRAVVGDAKRVDVDERRRRADGEAADLVGGARDSARAASAKASARRRCCRSRSSRRRRAAAQPTSTSTASRSRTALRYSLRFRRWNGTVRPGSGDSRGRAIELALEPRQRAAAFRSAVGPRAAVVRRHHAGLELAHDVLPDGRVGADVVEVERLERQVGRPLCVVVAVEAERSRRSRAAAPRARRAKGHMR